MAEPSQAFDPPRRVPTLGRQPEELHIPPTNSSVGSNSARSSQAQFSPPEYGSSFPPSISIQPSAAQQQQSQYSSGSNHSALPGALQPGHMNRPAPLNSSNTAPTLPTLPQISTQHPPPSTPKSATGSQAHSYSRSSPSGFDQKYARLGGTPDGGKFISPSSANYGAQTPQTATPYSPLGLADIRPHMELGMSDDAGMTPINNGGPQIPTNSNYVAPWAIYALDWCKWPIPPGSSSGGKVALGSYLEDNHNYVCDECFINFSIVYLSLHGPNDFSFFLHI